MSAEVKTGYAFEEVVIGTQTWMARNYDFGGPTGTFPNNSEANISDYGRLYTWAEAMAIDYPGWHLPTFSEFSTLISYLGGNASAGGPLKETGTTHWDSPNTGATNSTGFGGRGAGNSGSSFGEYACFWSADEFGETNAHLLSLYYNSTNAYVVNTVKTAALSVRLIKD